MTAHVITIEPWATERQREIPGQRPTIVRWRCSCGRLGAGVQLGGDTDARRSAERRARDAGQRHVAAMERG